MEFRKTKIIKGPSLNQLFEACKNIRKGQTEVFTIEVNDGKHLLPCYISAIDSGTEKSEVWALRLVVKSISLKRHGLDTEISRNLPEVTVDAIYSTVTFEGEINFPVD